MIALAALCVLAGILPGLVVDALAPAVAQLTAGARLPLQAAMPWLSLIPLAPERSSYNGLLVLAFITMSGFLAAFAIHRLASHAVRRAPAWDCGFPDPARQRSIPPAASPSRSAGSSGRWYFAPASGSRCRRREACSRRG